jgi:hypothetical protein
VRSALTLALALAATAPQLRAGAGGPAVGLHAGRDDTITQYEAFGAWIGRKVMYRVVFCDMSSWDGIASPWFLGTTRLWLESDPGRIEVITVPLLPRGEEGNFTAVTSGAHDREFRSFAEKIQSRGMASRVIVRLGWEGNGDWYPWAYASNPAGYRAAFRRAVQVMREVAPALRFEWCVTARASRRGGPAGWTEGYPGDDVVDIISMDVYDEYQPTWEGLRDGEAGLREFREFAMARGKPEAYPEWGCSVNAGAQGGGDNAEFVQQLADWFQGRPGGVLYQAYWNVSTGGPNAAIFGVASLPVPNAAAAYRRLFGAVAGPSEPAVE